MNPIPPERTWQRRGRLLRAARRGLRWAFARLGLEIERRRSPRFAGHGRHEAHLNRARILAACEIDLVIDVGANEGQYGRELRSTGYQGRIVSVEPVASAFAELRRVAGRDPAWECMRLAVSDADGEATVNVAAMTTYSSLRELPRRGPRTKRTGAESVMARRLDSLELARQGDRPLLKIDVQGMELEVLRGAERLLKTVEAVEVELSLVPFYEGQALYRETLDFLESRGFRLVGLDPGYTDPETAHMLQVDALLIRDTL